MVGEDATILNALLMLEDGFSLLGKTFAGKGEVFGEVVFNTTMNGYQEVITSPSSWRQLLCFTYPHIGNYGCRPADNESSKPTVNAVITKHYCKEPQSIEAFESLAEMLERNNVLGIEELDTRTLTLHIRRKGAMRGVISTETLEPGELKAKLERYCKETDDDYPKFFCTSNPTVWQHKTGDEHAEIAPESSEKPLKDVAVLDFGISFSILKALYNRGCRIKILSPDTDLETIKSLNPDGIFLGDGPGNPLIYESILPTIRALIGWKPLMAVGMGHQLTGMALGMDCYKMPFGHRGVNQPVKELESGRVLITRQNHGYNLLSPQTLPEDTDITHINLNDNTIEGIANDNLGCISAQFYPETGFGPHHCKNLYEYYMEML